MANANENAEPVQAEPHWRYIEDALRGLRFGVVTIIVQDGVVIQVERTERRRLPRSKKND